MTFSWAGWIVAMVALVVLVVMVGCAKDQGAYGACRQGIIAADASVITGHSLVAANVITREDGKKILLAARPAAAALSTWKTAIDNGGDPNAAGVAANAAAAAMRALSIELLAMEQAKGLPKINAAPGRGRQALSAEALRPQGTVNAGGGGNTLQVGSDLSAVITIIQLVADLSPQIVDWINAASARTVTAADVQASLDTLNRDIAVLEAAVATPTPNN